MAEVKLDYISVGGNRHPAAASWDRISGVLAFGADSNIALWDPLDDGQRGIIALLRGHTDLVNAVKFITLEGNEHPLIISGSVDNTIRIWRRHADHPSSYQEELTLTDHTGSVNCISALQQHSIFITGAADATVRVWRFGPSATDVSTKLSVTLVQTLSINPRFFPLAVAIANLDPHASGSQIETVIAVAGTKATIQIYATKTENADGGGFALVATLPGHEAWIRSLDIALENMHDVNSDLIIASASQDRYIRLWRLHRSHDLSKTSDAINSSALRLSDKASLSNKTHKFSTVSQRISITFEALLLGHEDWIYSVYWYRYQDRLQLLSASADNSLSVWEADESSGIWVSVARLGEISAQKGSTSATGSTGGFWTGLWSPDGSRVVSLGRSGSWRLWERSHDEGDGRWVQHSAVTGHVKEVNGIAWSKCGRYLLSTGNDQTTRLHAEWKRGDKSSWHEFSRPQIHGYDLNCISTITDSQFITGADEKLLRVFDEPQGVAEVLETLCGIEKPSIGRLPDTASIPVLGLSNKAVEASTLGVESGTNEEGQNGLDSDKPSLNLLPSLNEPPNEDRLARHMLWPEREKLYGHGYEINVLATSHDGSLVATACRASSVDHAVIRIYETKEWREINPPLKAHTLTVTGLQFSPQDDFLLSVGRDRQYCVWKRSSDGSSTYNLFLHDARAHSRMILSSSWGPFSAGPIFATGGRDKMIRIWRIKDASSVCEQTIATETPVTALAILPEIVYGKMIIAYGSEDGRIFVNAYVLEAAEISQYNIGTSLHHSKTITELAWRPTAKRTAPIYELAIASADNSLYVASIKLP